MDPNTTVHIIDDPRDSVGSYTKTVSVLTPGLTASPDQGVVYRSDIEEYAQSHPTILASAGGGHEPKFVGFVGKGMLSAACSGTVFASPNSTNILEGLEKIASPQGTILLIANYTGDLLNAGLAMTRAENARRGTRYGPVRLVCVGDDVSIPRSKVGKVGRRGLAGHILTLKYLCYLADTVPGITADELADRAETLLKGIGTVSCSFSRASHPNAIRTSAHDEEEILPPDTIELGMGAHGEPGLIRLSPIPSRPDLVSRMIDRLLDDKDPEFSYVDVKAGDEIYVLINSLGGTSDVELASWTSEFLAQISKHDIKVKGLRMGGFVTSLGMEGWGVSILRVPRNGADNGVTAKDVQAAFESPVECIGW